MKNYFIEVTANQTNDTYKLWKNDKDEYIIEFKQYDNGTDKEPTERWQHTLKADNYHEAVQEFFETVTIDVQHFGVDE